MVVAPLLRLVPEKVNLLVVLQVAQTVGFVPADGKHVETDLSADRILEPVVRELLSECLDEGLANVVLPVVLFEMVPLLLGAVAADGGDVDESRSVLHKRAPFDGDVEVRDVVQAEVDECLQPLFPQEVLDGLNAPTSTSLPISSLPR